MFEHFGSGGTTSLVPARTCLPAVRCVNCGTDQSHTCLALPGLCLPAATGSTKLSHVTRSESTVEVVTNRDFEVLKAAIKRRNPGITQIKPGMWIGPISLVTKGRLTDVIWDGVIPFFSHHVIEAMMDAGVILHPDRVSVVHGGKPAQAYFYCAPALVELWDPWTLAQYYDRCVACEELALKRNVSAVEANHGRAYRKAMWPDNEGIVYSTEHQDLLFSDNFVSIATKREFSGLAFQRVGKWV